MNKIERAKLVQKILNKYFPKAVITLKHTNPYTLLIAVLLSAQCTNEKSISDFFSFTRATTPEEMIVLTEKEIKEIIHSCGLSNTKAHAIWKLSWDLIKKYKGKVPKSFKALESLPGVGHKTASVVMSQAFGYPAFPVDTHIHRCAKRWGLSSGKNVVQTEKDLKRLFPRKSGIRCICKSSFLHANIARQEAMS